VRRLAPVALIAAMALGSVALWIGLPIGWLWVASQVQAGSTRPRMDAYLVVVVGLPASMVALGKLLAVLDRRYARVTHAAADERVRRPWLRSMRGERQVERRRTVLDVVMVVSVAIAATALAIWFFFFAGSSLPAS
jgi:hypothetical protein